jgi:hypothetical protein
MKRLIGLKSLEYVDLLIKLNLVDSKECRKILEMETGLRYVSSRRFDGENILLFKIVDNKTYCYARIKYEF